MILINLINVNHLIYYVQEKTPKVETAVILQKEVDNIPVILSKLQNSEKSNSLPLSKICVNVLLLFKSAYKWVLKRKEIF